MKVDVKGRLTIPANVLAAFGSGTEFFITNEDSKFARVYPVKVWKEIERRRADTHQPATGKLLTRAKYFGQSVTIDKQGQVLIPMVLRASAHIEGEVDVLGYAKCLDVWNHQSFLKNLERTSVTPHDEQVLNRLLCN